MINSFPNKTPFIVGMLGCKNNGFKGYGLYQLELITKSKFPNIIYIYGNLSVKEARNLFWTMDLKIIIFPDRRSRVWNGKKPQIIYFDGQKLIKEIYNTYGGEK